MARLESDSIGTLEVPENAYYGVQTLRGYNNFRITGLPANYGFILNVVKIKKAAAIVNEKVGSLDKTRADAIEKACDEILGGALKDEFITDAIQGGAGTTFNMNVNEVIANRATEILGGKKGEYTVHPNDHVNCSQSTNDVIPSAGKLTVLDLATELLKSLETLIDELNKKAAEFDGILKMGRTQLEDAVPIRLGQEFGAYASALQRNYERIEGVFLFYDITNEQSFDNIIKWLKDILEGGHKDLIVYLLGNKVDLVEERKVSYETGLNFAKSKNIKFMEISCKLDLNIADIIYFIIYDILKTENYYYSHKSKSFSLGKQSFKSNNKS